MIVPVGAGSANTNIKRPRKISSRPVGSSLTMAVAVRYYSVWLTSWPLAFMASALDLRNDTEQCAFAL